MFSVEYSANAIAGPNKNAVNSRLPNFLATLLPDIPLPLRLGYLQKRNFNFYYICQACFIFLLLYKNKLRKLFLLFIVVN